MKKTLYLFAFISTLLIGCSKDDDSSSSNKSIALITVKDIDGKTIPNTEIYAFSDYSWEINNQKAEFAEWTKKTDQKGLAVFDNLNDEKLMFYKQGLQEIPVELRPTKAYKEGTFYFVIKHQNADFVTTVDFEKGERRHFVITLK